MGYRTPLLILTCLSACGGGLTPEAVAEAYLRAGSTENDAEIRANLDPACHSNEGMVRVDAVRMMGAPITIEELTLTPGASGDGSASVTYEVAGPAHSSGGMQEMFGIQVTTGEVNIDHASQSGTIRLRQVDGRWMVACN